MSTTARDALTAFYAAHPDVANADGDAFLALPTALTAELDVLLAAACLEKTAANLLCVIDPATGICEITRNPGGMNSGTRVFTAGRNANGQYASWDALRVTVTAKGHWYRSDDPMDEFSNDRKCRGCGHHGHFDYILDYRPCGKPATSEDIVRALKPKAKMFAAA